MSGWSNVNDSEVFTFTTTTANSMTTLKTPVTGFLEQESTCTTDSVVAHVLQLILACLCLPVHIFVLLAMILFRNSTKQNWVNIYAANVITASVLVNCMRVYLHGEVLSVTVNFHNVTQSRSTDVAHDRWVLQETLSELMILVLAGSIGLVIVVLKKSMLRLRRTVAGLTRRETLDGEIERPKKRSLYKRLKRLTVRHPRYFAGVTITAVWILPLLLVVPATTLNSCDLECYCLYGHRPTDPSLYNCPNSNGCSAFMPPLSLVIVRAGVGLWFSYITILGLLMLKTTRDLKQLVLRRKVTVGSNDNNELSSVHDDGVEENDDKQSNDHTSRDSGMVEKVIDKSNNGDATIETPKMPVIEKTASRRLSRKKRRNTAPPGTLLLQGGIRSTRLLFIMYLSYILGTGPLCIYALYDTFSSNDITEPVAPSVIPILVLPLFGEVICTVTLCIYLPGIKVATRSLFVALGRCFR